MAPQCCLLPPPLSRLSVPHAREDFQPLVHGGLVQVGLEADHQDASSLGAGVGMAGAQDKYNPMVGGRHSGLGAGGVCPGTAHAGMAGVGRVQAGTAGVGMACIGTAGAQTAHTGTARAGKARTGTARAGKARTGTMRTGMGGAGAARVEAVHAGTLGSRVASGEMYHGPAYEEVRSFPDQ